MTPVRWTPILIIAGYLSTGSCAPRGGAPVVERPPSADSPADTDVPTASVANYRPVASGAIPTPFDGVVLQTPPLLHDEPSAGGRQIPYWVFGDGGPTTLILAGMHGGEHSPALLGFRFVEWLERNSGAVVRGRLVVAPLVDPDGLAAGIRGNGNRVDLNRNYPAKNWKMARGSNSNWHGSRPGSESETRFVLGLIKRYRPSCIISVHAALACVNYDGPARRLATIMSDACGMPVKASVGYPTPGSFGSYAGIDLRIPTITLELRSKLKLNPPFEACRDAFLAAHEYSLNHAG